MKMPDYKIVDIDTAIEWRKQLAEKNKKLVITNGCFDILHKGHIHYLFEARAQGDALLLLINSDSSIQELKGKSRPIIQEESRTYLLAALECVDRIVVFPNARATEEFRQLSPDIYVKGGDYTEETLDKKEYTALKKTGCDFIFIPFLQGFSTTKILEKIKNN
ncbi:MAG: adenylyltransferase/cytidyltransferase family protein [Verrucomicrobiota bacterium]|nr:adenylyltransferase/cytidyltransferase family protein [Verrucomicrobiota bacterium]